MNKVILSTLFVVLAIQGLNCQTSSVTWTATASSVFGFNFNPIDLDHWCFDTFDSFWSFASLSVNLLAYQGQALLGTGAYVTASNLLVPAKVRTASITNSNAATLFRTRFTTAQNNFHNTASSFSLAAEANVTITVDECNFAVTSSASAFGEAVYEHEHPDCSPYTDAYVSAMNTFHASFDACWATYEEAVRAANARAAATLDTTAASWQTLLNITSNCFKTQCTSLSFTALGCPSCANDIFRFTGTATVTTNLVNCLNANSNNINTAANNINATVTTALNTLHADYHLAHDQFSTCAHSAVEIAEASLLAALDGLLECHTAHPTTTAAPETTPA